MKKSEAINLLGGTAASAAKEIGITIQAVNKWPDPLTDAIRDRVQAALYRRGEVVATPVTTTELIPAYLPPAWPQARPAQPQT